MDQAMSIRFDDAAADELVDQLELTVRSLLELADKLQSLLPATTEDWQGRFRHTFDVEASRHPAHGQAVRG